MAGTAILEREIVKRGDEQSPAVDRAALEHSRRIAENYRALEFTAVREERAPAAEKPSAPAASAAAPLLAPKKKMLFEGLSYKDGVLTGEREKTEEKPQAKPAAASVAVPAASPVAAPASEDDAVPTRRTMDTLNRAAEVRAEETAAVRVNFFSCLSAKMKLVLCSVVAAIVLLIAVVCINTGIINSLDANIETLRERAAEQRATYEQISEELSEASDPFNANVEEYARENGMVQEN